MAESLAQRLQRIAREKAASAAGGASAVTQVAQPTQVTQVQVTEKVSDEHDDGSIEEVSRRGTCAGTGETESSSTPVADVEPDSTRGTGQNASTTNEVESVNSLVSVIEHSDSLPAVASTVTAEPSTHPLAMAFAELEAGLLARDPEFKTKLRDIHRHLGREPELVTQMTEEEIALIVTGMVVFANTEIVEPAAKKAGKAAVKAASKVVISADDL